LRDMMSDMRDDDAREPGHGGMPSRPVHARLISIVSPEFLHGSKLGMRVFKDQQIRNALGQFGRKRATAGTQFGRTIGEAAGGNICPN
jgi:hypothetical protein